MVDLAEIQAAYYMVAATGVLVAAVYYILNMRAAERNKKIQLSTSIAEKLGSKDFQRDFVQLLRLDWRDVDDYMKRYDSTVNIENYAQRWSVWSGFENLGYLLREGLIDGDMVANSLGLTSVMVWGRYWPVIKYYRERELGPNFFENFEYLAREMWRIGKVHGYVSPGFKSGLLCDRFKDVFEPPTASPVSQ